MISILVFSQTCRIQQSQQQPFKNKKILKTAGSKQKIDNTITEHECNGIQQETQINFQVSCYMIVFQDRHLTKNKHYVLVVQKKYHVVVSVFQHNEKNETLLVHVYLQGSFSFWETNICCERWRKSLYFKCKCYFEHSIIVTYLLFFDKLVMLQFVNLE